MPQVHLDKRVVGQVDGAHALPVDSLHEVLHGRARRRRLARALGCAQRHAPQDVRLIPRQRLAVLELGDRQVADGGDQPLEVSRGLADGGGEHGLLLQPHVRELADQAELVEVHIGARGHAHHRLVLEALPAQVVLGAREGERARRLQDGAGVLKHVLDGRADRVGGDEHHPIHQLPAEAEALCTHGPHRHAVGEPVHALEHHPLAPGQPLRHGVGAHRLHADHLDLGPQLLDNRGDACDEAAAADGHEDGVQVVGALAEDLQADRSLPRDHQGVVEGRDEHPPVLNSPVLRIRLRGVVRIPDQHHLATQPLDALHLDRGRRFGHGDDGARAQLAR
mmetsp:Transcript_35055/g.110781  ORF Transcript_35055/g.110781 Transcript_35055/m.110781 type:complete len:336 (-) Transcript_35055:794-1801(-)